MFKRFVHSNIGAAVLNMLVAYLVWMLSRVAFFMENWSTFAPYMSWSLFKSMLHGALVFDTSALLYVNSLYLLLMLLPVLVGIGVNYAWPRAAQTIDRGLSKIAFPALMLLITVFFIQNYRTIFDNIGRVGLAVVMLIGLAMACAALLSRWGRLKGQQHRTVIIEVGMQNAAQAIAVATSPFIFNSQEIAIPAVLYSLIMNLVLLPYVAIVRKRAV